MTSRRVSLVALFLALLGLLVVPEPTYAQQEMEPWDTDQDSFRNLIEAIENIQAQIRALEQQDVQNVQFVSLEDIRGELDENQERQLDQALQETSTKELHRSLNQHEAISSSMEEVREDVNVRDVVAMNVQKNGDVVVFYDPMM